MSKTTLSWKDEVTSRAEGLIGLRRDFHRHPELSMAERRTAGVIAERLQAAGLEVRTGSEATGAETAVVGILHGERPGRTIAWRADIDALPLNEIPNLPFKSAVPGAMHACGHDGHAAVAITMAEILAARRGELPGTAVFIFQPAEETLGGAQRMIEAGVLDDPPVEKVYGIHLTTLLPAGQVGVRPGPVMASSDFFEVEVKGSGGHGAYPHLSIDPITAASHILIGMQDLVSREIDPTQPAVMTIGEIKGGNRHNIIPETAIMRGSIRAFDQQVRDQLVERLGAYASRMARAYRAEARVTIGGQCCPAVVNPEDEAGHVHRCAAGEIGEEQVTAPPPVMGSDDMSLFLQARPGCYFWVGAAPADKPPAPHHHPAFELNEDSLAVGVRTGLAVMMGALAAP